MPYPPAHRERTRKRIVRSAQALFNRRGFDGVSIDEVMAAAGLTRGGFYSYFRSKSELYAEALSLVITEPVSDRWPSVSFDRTAIDAARHVVRAYLSDEHYEDIDGSCPMVALPSDVSRRTPRSSVRSRPSSTRWSASSTGASPVRDARIDRAPSRSPRSASGAWSWRVGSTTARSPTRFATPPCGRR